MAENSSNEAGPINFGQRLANSQAFSALFREGMALVEETASYLDGPGRQESKRLERNIALAYATESMRLPERLQDLIERSRALQAKVRRLDATIHATAEEPQQTSNPLESQLGLLKAAFEHRGGS
jgi:regulator of CtrA degradation